MSGYLLYNYTPSLASAIICMFLFIGLTFGHIFFVWKHKTIFFITFIIGGLFEAIGYGARAANAHEAPNYSTIPYALQSLFVLLAPSLFAASIYMILGRIIRLVDGDSRSLIRATRLTKIFVLGDVLSFFIQSGGGGIMSSAKTASSMKLGEHVIIVGLIVQIIFFGFFVVVSVVFHKRMANNPTSAAMATSVDWHRYMLVLYVASGLIMTRCLYRVIEYIQGSTGLFQSHEYFAYVFDAALMLLVTIIFLVYHPSQIISGGHRKFDNMELMRGEGA
ncbi:RTA-like protein [Penicillium expansum]|uniref:RTA-like protein n=1 Tax=Penicillium expansum TaxID=27334 RepID=A0A0A2KFP5_PENEN|nr:RTA-like protein [Penicillium expansum]KGO41849.1 RTA-like protein [Penicillium expansum]KGO51156.1 RTA-like protein [Penicillium expansum]KGO65763.1 RTA-like protein [Penicillium expansum]